MKSSRAKGLGFVILAVLVASTSALAVDIPLTNWTVPAYHSSEASGGITTMGDVTLGNAFIGVAPCRIVDTRAVSAFPAGYGPPSLAAGIARNFDLNSNLTKCPGIPASVQAYSLNITVTNTLGNGFILIYPQGGAQPPVSTLNYVAGQTIANAAIVPAGTSGGVTVIAGVAGTDLLIDINGYFSLSYNDGVAFEAVGNVAAGFLPGFLVLGSNANTGNAAYAVWGLNSGGGTTMTNVSGAVTGWSLSATGINAGVYGLDSSTANGAAGVLGVDSSGPAAGIHYDHAGVLGLATTGQGVVGRVSNSAAEAVLGIQTDGAGAIQTQGFLGYTTTVAVEAIGNIAKTGTVSFEEPHPSDASKKLVYIALEGNEAGTYFRGRGKFQNGQAVINVPEDFRMVTLPDGLGIQVTPIGQMATVAVASIGLDRIVVNGSRNVEFFYTVNGIRRGYAGFRPIVENDKEFQPESPDDRMPGVFNEEIRTRLIANGTYKPDGTVNMETAQRLGWDRVWAAKQVLPPRPQLQDSP
jgi:hypothetical protein